MDVKSVNVPESISSNLRFVPEVKTGIMENLQEFITALYNKESLFFNCVGKSTIKTEIKLNQKLLTKENKLQKSRTVFIKQKHWRKNNEMNWLSDKSSVDEN
jgi:hypothetical protein